MCVELEGTTRAFLIHSRDPIAPTPFVYAHVPPCHALHTILSTPVAEMARTTRARKSKRHAPYEKPSDDEAASEMQSAVKDDPAAETSRPNDDKVDRTPADARVKLESSDDAGGDSSKLGAKQSSGVVPYKFDEHIQAWVFTVPKELIEEQHEHMIRHLASRANSKFKGVSSKRHKRHFPETKLKVQLDFDVSSRFIKIGLSIDQFRLCGLPAELRSAILKEVLIVSDVENPISIYKHQESGLRLRPQRWSNPFPNVHSGLGLLGASHDLREEALHLFYSYNFFSFATFETFNAFAAVAPATLDYIRSIQIVNVAIGTKPTQATFYETVRNMSALQDFQIGYIGGLGYRGSVTKWMTGKFLVMRPLLHALVRKHETIKEAMKHFSLPTCRCGTCDYDTKDMAKTLVRELLEADQAELDVRKKTLRPRKKG